MSTSSIHPSIHPTIRNSIQKLHLIMIMMISISSLLMLCISVCCVLFIHPVPICRAQTPVPSPFAAYVFSMTSRYTAPWSPRQDGRIFNNVAPIPYTGVYGANASTTTGVLPTGSFVLWSGSNTGNNDVRQESQESRTATTP